MIALLLLAVLVLILLNAFFVAAEYGLVTARRTRIIELQHQGNRRARDVLRITGDPPRMGTYPDATAVFDVDAIGLTNMATRLNQGLDIGGNPIGQPTGWHIGVGVQSGLRHWRWRGIEDGHEQ